MDTTFPQVYIASSLHKLANEAVTGEGGYVLRFAAQVKKVPSP